jgi:hypothetical protein
MIRRESTYVLPQGIFLWDEKQTQRLLCRDLELEMVNDALGIISSHSSRVPQQCNVP